MTVGAAAGTGLQLKTTNGSSVKNTGICNCAFTDAPVGGSGIDLSDAGVENTIVIGNNLTPNGGTAFIDSGTNTEAGHNIF
jgi:hypothetical protein